MMTTMPHNLLAAAARLTAWSSLLRRTPPARSHSLLLPRAGATTRAIVDSITCDRPTSIPARSARLDLPPRSARQAPACHPGLPSTPRPVRATLRVVRIVEADQAPTSGGRIVMCGRMADVCAELDRMVEREAALFARA